VTSCDLEARRLVKHDFVATIGRRRRTIRPAWWHPAAIVAVIVLLAACSTTTPSARSGRVVTSQYNNWTMRISPSLTDRWRARVQVWPPEVRPETHGGINLYFTESAATESAIVQAASTLARRYIDASRSTH
jgi:hypothetical protein